MANRPSEFVAQVSCLAAVLGLTSLGAIAAEKPAAKPPLTSSDPFASLFDDPAVARGKGVEVKQSQVQDAFTAFKAQMAVRNQVVPEARRQILEAQLLDGLITTQILVNQATEGDKTVAQGRAEKNFAEFKKVAGSEDILRSQLTARGMTIDQFVARIVADETARAVLERVFESKIKIPDEQVKELYETGLDLKVKLMQEDLERLAKDPNSTADQLSRLKTQIDAIKKANLARLELPEKVRVSHILIATRNRDTDEELPLPEQRVKRELADKILARAKAGEEFGKLVKEFSEDRNLKETGGEYTFSRDDPFVQEFKSAAFSLAPGQISDLVTTMFGFHIIKVHERIPGKKVEFDKISKDLKEALVEQEFQRQKPAYMEELKKEAGVEILVEKYKLPKAALRDEAKTSQ